jgi:hypothetical protein
MNEYDFPTPVEPGEYTLFAEVPSPVADELAVEVVLRTDSYFTTITDARMQSFRIVSARIR